MFFSPLSPRLFLLFLNTVEDLTTNWNHLTLSDKEGSGCYLDEEVSSQEFFLHKVSNKKGERKIDAIAKTFTPF